MRRKEARTPHDARKLFAEPVLGASRRTGGVGELWESGHRGPVPVPGPVPTRPHTDQMVADVVRKPVITREGPLSSRVGGRSRAAPPWGTRKPRRRSRRPQTRVQRLAKNYQNRGPTQRRNSPGQGPERVGKAVDAKHAGRGHQGALGTASRRGAGGQGSKQRRGPSGAAKEAEAGKGRSDIQGDGYDAVLYGGVRRRPARRSEEVRKARWVGR